MNNFMPYINFKEELDRIEILDPRSVGFLDKFLEFNLGLEFENNRGVNKTINWCQIGGTYRIAKIAWVNGD